MNEGEFLWTEKYRPQTIEDTILPDSFKQTFKKFVEQGNIPNLILSGSAGVGKTTVAKAMLKELGYDYYVINGSLNGNIDTLRTEIQNFASTISFSGGRKYVILDEADYLNANSTQPALRNFMEEYSKNCGFILTCNYINKIIDPLRSRCAVIEFKIPKKEMPNLALQFMKRVTKILKQENIEFDNNVVAEVITKYFPDCRRILNEMQRYSATGKIDTGILVNFSEETIKSLVAHMKTKNFTGLRKWVAENSDIGTAELFRRLYDIASDVITPQSVPQLVLHLANYQYKDAFVADHEINLVACFTEIMVDCEFK